MKRIFASAAVLIGSLAVVQLSRYSSRSTAVMAEWVAVIACLMLIAFSVWAALKFFSNRSATGGIELDSKTAQDFGISKRELEVLELVAEGYSNRQISETLFVSENTVKKHVSNLLGKLEAKRRTEAVKIAFDKKLISRT